MSEKQVIVTLEDGFGRVQTSIATSLSAPQLMDKIMEIDEQQATITELERKLKKYAKIGEEQLKQIMELQDLCGESDSENAKLRIENKKLKEELNDCEKFRYTVFKRLNEEYIKECSIK